MELLADCVITLSLLEVDAAVALNAPEGEELLALGDAVTTILMDFDTNE